MLIPDKISKWIPKLGLEWFTLSWYKYLFEKPFGYRKLTVFMIWCRACNHPNGIWFYNVGGMEPDTTCKDCGEDIG